MNPVEPKPDRRAADRPPAIGALANEIVRAMTPATTVVLVGTPAVGMGSNPKQVRGSQGIQQLGANSDTPRLRAIELVDGPHP